MIEVFLSKIIIDEAKKEQVIILKDKNNQRLLPIVIGLTEAAAIRIHLNGFIPPRPLTHDLFYSFLKELGVTMEKVVIDKLIESTFHAKIYLCKNQNTIIIDARPSDSIALAVRTKAPIFVEEKVFQILGISDT